MIFLLPSYIVCWAEHTISYNWGTNISY